ncbi:membrane protein of unknown function [Nitrospina watsonii]|uniref:Zinc ribbon domain-containing protein n=1 Tax=Nitrospina watsonii TaxID=1323948 RepID=A0ABN8VYL2_9BACT|nr:membrane protein of unknown function [Nitrospina watsonii]
MSKDKPGRNSRKQEPDRFLEIEAPSEAPRPVAPRTPAKPRRTLNRSRTKPDPVAEREPGLWAQLWAPASWPWQPVSGMALGCTSAVFAYLMYLMAVDPGMMDRAALRFLHQVNLVFHEFGHPAFGLFGETIGILGGTLGQLLIPAIVLVAFWRRRDTLGFAVGVFWLFENFLDIAVYMADARALRLPLIGGLGAEAHDWRNLFFQWGLIMQDTQIAAITRTLGWIGMIWIWIWLAWRWLASDRKPKF